MSDLLNIVKIIAEIEGQKEPLVFENPDKNPPKLSIPEKTKYKQTIKFTVKNKTLKKLRNKVQVKKAGLVVNERESYIGDEFAPSDETYTVTLPEQETPSGFLVRGTFAAYTTYYVEDDELYTVPWTLEITKKK